MQIPRTIFYKLKQEVLFFNNFTDEELLLFLKLMKTKTYQNGAVIFKEFDSGETMYILFQGEVEVRKRIGKKLGVIQETVIATLGSGECFGEIGMIDNRPRSASAVCTKDVLLFTISLDKVLKIARNPKFAFLSFKLFRNFSIMLATRLRETNQKVVDLTVQFSSPSTVIGAESLIDEADPKEES